MKSVVLSVALFAFLSCFLVVEAGKSVKEMSMSGQAQQLLFQMFDTISRGDLRREGRSITKRKMAWLKTEELMSMPLMKLHSIPDKSWSGLTKNQASKLSAAFVARLSQEQARFISLQVVKAMPEGSRRAHARLVNRPSAWFRLSSMAVAGGLAFVLYHYTSAPMRVKRQKC